jgi:hypothetical protein
VAATSPASRTSGVATRTSAPGSLIANAAYGQLPAARLTTKTIPQARPAPLTTTQRGGDNLRCDGALALVPAAVVMRCVGSPGDGAYDTFGSSYSAP